MILVNKDLSCLKCYLEKNLFIVCCLKLHYSKQKPFIKLSTQAETNRFILVANSVSKNSQGERLRFRNTRAGL